ncbi:MAG: helix-turn-helix domain-containing protein [Bryobacteraceae bacterium]
MQTLGQRLRAEREKMGRSIPELARLSRIRVEYFEALEEGRPEQFPGPFFYRSFLRQYAALLELPESFVEPEIQRALDEERAAALERDAQPADTRPDVPPLPTGRTDLKLETRRWLTRLASLVAVLALCSGTYFAWLRWGQRLFQEDRKLASAAKPARPETAPRPPAAGAPPPAAPASATALQNPPPAQPTALPAAPPAAQAAPALASGSGPQPAQREGDLTVQASALCWVDAWRDGKRFYGAMLRPGSSVGFAAAGTLRLRFGNAGAVTLRLKGQTLPALGPPGQVRTIELQNGEYRLVAPAPPAPLKQ